MSRRPSSSESRSEPPRGSDGEPGATVVVYSRPGCHLCEQAVDGLVALHEEGYRFSLHEIDIESEELLLRVYLERIPVVEVNGEVASELVFDKGAVRARLDRVGAWSR